MTLDLRQSQRLHNELAAAGLPVASCGIDALGEPYCYLSNPQPGQEQQADQILEQWDRRKRKPKAISAIRSEIEALTLLQQQALIDDLQMELIAALIQKNPDIATTHGITGDEIDE